MNRVSETLARLARLDLDEGPAFPPLDGAEQTRALELLAEHRLTGVAVRAMESGFLELDERTGADLVAHHETVMAQTMRVEITMLRVASVLERAGIDFRVVKGSALAHTVATRPADREFRDVDILVRAADLDRTVAEVRSCGGHRVQPALSADFDRRFGKSVTLRLDGVEVDLHRTLAPGPYGVRMFPGDLFLVPRRFEVAGRAMPTLDGTDHLLHACYHVALGQSVPALTNLRDVALLAASAWDVERFAATVERWHGRAVVARAVRLVHELVDHVLPPALQAFVAAPGDAEQLAPYLQDGNRFPALALATFRALPARDRVAFARAVALPAGSGPRGRLGELWEARPGR